MSSKYAATADRSLAAIARKGSTFTLGTTSGTPIYDPATDSWSGSTSALATGRAVQIANNLQQLVALNLVTEKTITLLAAAKGLTVEPKKGMVLTWADGVAYSIEDVQSVAPDGPPIIYTIVAAT